jgi:hypothetical protein
MSDQIENDMTPSAAAGPIRGRALGMPADGHQQVSQRMHRMWTNAQAALVEKVGETAALRIVPGPQGPDVFAFSEGSPAALALAEVHQSEDELTASSHAGASVASLKPLEDAVDASVATFVNVATRGLPSAAEARRRAAVEQEAAWR